LSKRLATINLNSPVELDEAGLEMCAPSKDLLEPLFAELEFRTWAAAFLATISALPKPALYRYKPICLASRLPVRAP
jgi:hypothetical protein